MAQLQLQLDTTLPSGTIGRREDIFSGETLKMLERGDQTPLPLDIPEDIDDSNFGIIQQDDETLNRPIDIVKPLDESLSGPLNAKRQVGMPEGQADQIAAMASVLSDPVTTIKTFERIRSDLITTGRSPLVDILIADAQEQEVLRDKEDLLLLATDDTRTDAQKIADIAESIEVFKNRSLPTISEVFMETMIIGAATDDNNAEEVHIGLVSGVADIFDAHEFIPILIQRGLDLDADAALSDFVAVALLPGYGINVVEVIRATEPSLVDSFLGDALLPGAIIVRTREHMRFLDARGRVEFAQRLIENINNNLFWGGENGLLKFDLAQTILGDLNQLPEEIDSDKYLNNLFGILDILAVVELVRVGTMTAKLGKAALKASKGNMDDIRRLSDKFMRGIPGRTKKSSVDGKLGAVAPEEANAMVKAGMADDTGKTSRALGETQESLATEHGLPKQIDDEVRVGPDIHDPQDAALDVDLTLTAFSPEEIRIARGDLDVRVQANASLTPTQLHSKTGIETIAGGFRALYRFGDSNTRGYANRRTAEKIAKFLERTEPGAKARLLIRDHKLDEFVSIDQLNRAQRRAQEKNEYLIELEVKHLMNPEDALSFEEIGKAGGTTRPIVENGFTGLLAKAFDKSTSFIEMVRRGGNMGADRSSIIKAELEKIMLPFRKASKDSREKALALIHEGIKETKWFSVNEIRTFYSSEANLGEIIDAYMSVRRHQGKMLSLINGKAKRILEGQGWKHIRINNLRNTDDKDFLGKVIDSDAIPSDVTRVFDSGTGKMRDVTRVEMQALQDQGSRWIKFRGSETNPSSFIKVGGETAEFMLIKPNQRFIVIKQLPDQVIREIPGYISRIYDATHIVRKAVLRKVNGKPPVIGFVPIRILNNPGDAQAHQLRLLDEVTDADFKALQVVNSKLIRTKEDMIAVTLSREITDASEYGSRQNIDFLMDTGQLFYSKRGHEIGGLDGTSSLRSIMDSIEIARRRVSQDVGMGFVVDKLVRNWEKTYGGKFGDSGKFPWTKDVAPQRIVGDKLERQDAIALRDHILMLEGIDTSFTRRTWKRMMVDLADKVATPHPDQFWSQLVRGSIKSNKFSAFLLNQRNLSPIDRAKQFSFAKFIVFSPIRQLFLQSQQATVYLGLEHGMKYFLGDRGALDVMGMVMGLSSRSTKFWTAPSARFGGKSARQTLSKGMGMTEKEYEQFIDAYRATGLDASVDSHTYASILALDPQEVAGTSGFIKRSRQLNNARKQVLKVMRRIGFDPGERFQLLTAFLAVRNKWMKNNPKIASRWNSPEILGDLGAQARELSFNMNRAGVVAFQRGISGLMFQFMSHTTKSIQVLIPEKALGSFIGRFSNKVFTGKERARIATLQLALYGTAGLGLDEAYDFLRAALETEGIDIPEEADLAIRQGIFGGVLNAMLRAAEDEENFKADVDLGGSFGVFAGLGGALPSAGGVATNPISKVYNALFLSPIGAAELFLGPTFAVGSDAIEFLRFSSFVVGDIELPEGTSAILLVLDSFMRQLPVYNNFAKMRTAQAINRVVTNSGNETVAATGNELLAKGILGLQTTRERQVREAIRDLRGSIQRGVEPTVADLDQIAKDYYKYTKQILQRTGDGKATREEMSKLALDNVRGLKTVLQEEEFFFVMNRFKDIMFSDLNKQGTEAELIRIMTNMTESGILTLDDAEQRIREMRAFPGSKELLDWIDDVQHRLEQ